jgi:hypothetical protein
LQIPANALLFCWVAGTAVGLPGELESRRRRVAVSLPGTHDDVGLAESTG